MAAIVDGARTYEGEAVKLSQAHDLPVLPHQGARAVREEAAGAHDDTKVIDSANLQGARWRGALWERRQLRHHAVIPDVTSIVDGTGDLSEIV